MPTGRRFAPWFKPDFGDDLFLCQNGFGRAVFFKKAALQGLTLPSAAGLDEGIYAAALEATLASGRDPLHCPGILVHVGGDPAVSPRTRVLYLAGSTRRQIAESFVARRASLAGAKVEGPDPHGFLRLRHPLPDPLPLVSIVIPTRDRKDLLEACINSLDRATSYRNKEVIILDNDSAEAGDQGLFCGSGAAARRADRAGARAVQLSAPDQSRRVPCARRTADDAQQRYRSVRARLAERDGEPGVAAGRGAGRLPAALSRPQRAACRRDRRA